MLTKYVVIFAARNFTVALYRIESDCAPEAIRQAYDTHARDKSNATPVLALVSFESIGKTEVRAWRVRRGKLSLIL